MGRIRRLFLVPFPSSVLQSHRTFTVPSGCYRRTGSVSVDGIVTCGFSMFGGSKGRVWRLLCFRDFFLCADVKRTNSKVFLSSATYDRGKVNGFWSWRRLIVALGLQEVSFDSLSCSVHTIHLPLSIGCYRYGALSSSSRTETLGYVVGDVVWRSKLGWLNLQRRKSARIYKSTAP